MNEEKKTQTIRVGHADGESRGLPDETLAGRILVVDDQTPSRVYLRKLLVAHGCEVTDVSNSEAALLHIRKDPPDLALVDVVMPGGTGYDVCRQIKQDPINQNIPVILVTSRTGIEDVEEGFIAGAFDYIRKPFNPRELIVRVRNALESKRSHEALRLWKQKMSRELEIAGSLQRKLFSTKPLFGSEFEVHMAYHPSYTVGGDVFDVLSLSDGWLCVYVGDVAGHGVAPAIVASLLKAIIAEVARDFVTLGPAAICREIQSRFRYHVETPELYATLFLAVLSPDRDCWICMNCGHPSPILIGAGGVDLSENLVGGGDVPIGVSLANGRPYVADQQVTAPAEPGSKLLLITDGLFESRQRDSGEQCGAEHLQEIAMKILRDDRVINPAMAIIEALRGEGYSLSEDDSSAIVVERIDPETIWMETSISLDLCAMAETATRAARLLQEKGWSEEASGAVQLVLMEYGTNVVQHSRAPSGSTLFFQMRLTGPICRMLFKDQGCEWDAAVRLKEANELPMYRDRGRGLSIIQALSVHTEFFRRENENIAFFAISREYNKQINRQES